MSRDFYRRDFDGYRPLRRDEDGDLKPERSRDTSRPRSDSRPAVSRPRTEDWASFSSRSRRSSLQQEAITDPRLRHAPTKSVTGTAHESRSTSQDDTLRKASENALAPAHSMASPISLEGPSDIERAHNRHEDNDKKPASLVDTIASVLITFSNEAYSAGLSKERVELAKKQLVAKEQTDQQNRRSNWTILIEQGEEDRKIATKQLEDAKARAQKTKEAMTNAATTAAACIVELTQAANAAQSLDQTTGQQEAERIALLETTVSTLKKELVEARKDIWDTRVIAQSTATDAAKMRVEVIDPLAFTVAGTNKHVTAIIPKIEASASTQNEFKTLMGTLRAEFQGFRDENRAEKSSVEANGVRADLYAKHETLTRVEDGINEKAARLHSGQTKLRSDIDELQVDIQRIKTENRYREGKATDHSVPQDLKNLKASVDELLLKLSSMVQRTTLTQETNRINQLIATLDSTQQSHHKLQAADVADCRAEILTIKNDSASIQHTIREILEDRNTKEVFISEHYQGLKESLDVITADLDDLREDFKSDSRRTPEPPITHAATNTQEIGLLQSAVSGIRKDYDWLKDEFRRSQEGVAKLQPEVRGAIDGNKANAHSIRALTQRYNNISTEDMAHAMLRQVERLYPHVAQVQANFDALWKETSRLGDDYRSIHKALADHVNSNFDSVRKEINATGAKVKKNDIECRDLFNNIVNDVKSLRCSLKAEMDQDIKRIAELHVTVQTQVADLQERVAKFKAPREDADYATPPTLNDKPGVWGELKNAEKHLPSIDSPSAHSEGTDCLTAWTKPAATTSTEIIDLEARSRSNSAEDSPLSAQRPRTTDSRLSRTNGVDNNRKRKRDGRQGSDDVRVMDERQGSGALLAKFPRKGGGITMVRSELGAPRES